MPVHISRLLHDRMMAQAHASPDHEVCGLLLGVSGAITEIRPAPNVADDPRTRFEVDPVILLAAHRAARRGGLAVIGHYHSHPNGSSAPSPADAAAAGVDGLLWLIIGETDARLWQAGPDGLHGRFQARQLIVEAH
ncbi:MAG: Mov34/MPN/PAD-1 family protein [Sphingobium sp.]